MARYPDSPIPQAPYPFRSNRPTVGGGPEWAPQNRPLTRFGLGEADLSYACLTDADWDTELKVLYDFFESVRGSSGRFTFADFNGWDSGGRAWSGLFVAKGDGITIAWDLPTYALVASPAPIVYENGSVKTSDVDPAVPDSAVAYHITTGDGTDGIDLLTAGAATTTVATAPSPATSGTSLVVAAGAGAHFPATPFYANVWPTSVAPTVANVETIHVTTVTTDTLTFTRGTSARTIIVGDQIAVPPASTVILTIDATCRRAFRRAKFTNVKNPFTWDPPEMSTAGPVTIVEVRK